jgi:acyl-coenzyme A thioesterase PaaI-like protein
MGLVIAYPDHIDFCQFGYRRIPRGGAWRYNSIRRTAWEAMKVFETMQRKPLKVSDPEFERKIRESFEFQGFKKLGGELREVRLGFVEAHLPYSDYVRQQHGFFHYTVLDPGEECVSAEFKINFLQPARGEKLIARGGIIKVGRTLVISEATVSVVRDGEEHECAIMMHTLARVKHFKSGANK